MVIVYNDLITNYNDLIDIGAWLTFAVSLIVLIFEIRKSRKTTFINTVTEARKEFIKKLRDLVSEFVYIAMLTADKQNASKDKKKKQNRLNRLGYQLQMMMNPAGFIEEWDGEAVNMISKIMDDPKENEKVIGEFVMLMQSWLALEWHGMMNEGRNGVLKRNKKDKLRKKYWEEYDYFKHLNK